MLKQLVPQEIYSVYSDQVRLEMLDHKLCKGSTSAVLNVPPQGIAWSKGLIKVSVIQQRVKTSRFATLYNFIELLNKYLFSSHYGPGTILNAL